MIGLFPELLSNGGVQRAGRHTAAALATYAKQCCMGYRFLSLNDPPSVHSRKVGDHAFTFSGFGRAKARLALAALPPVLAKRPIVISAHPNLAPVAWALRALAPNLNSIVLTHGIEVWTPLSSLRRRALRRADLVLAPSAYTAEKIVSVQGVRAAKVFQLPWGLDPEFTSAFDSRGCEGGGTRFPHGRVILTVGRLAANERYKGLDVLLEAFPRVLSAVPDLYLVVVGDGDDRPRFEAMVKGKGLADRVWFLGALEQNDLLTCYRRCDVFAMPSRGEGFGLVFLEAMVLGKPVLGPSYGAPAEFIRHGQHGLLVDPEDANAIGQALVELLATPDRARQMGQAARQWVMQEYSFERFRERLYGLLRDHLLQGTLARTPSSDVEGRSRV